MDPPVLVHGGELRDGRGEEGSEERVGFFFCVVRRREGRVNREGGPGPGARGHVKVRTTMFFHEDL